ncbi:hypothetical protein NIES2101_05820 [Calothrix sp. HK-06]|nr:hypothetical protein NIES2101_05820 [Calothrix sp. HK-06]
MKNTSILFIDSAVDNYEILLQFVTSGIKTVVLDAAQDGVAQITSALSRYHGVENVHIVSHGAPGTLYLGNGTLELNNLLHYTEQLQEWFASLPKESSLLLYGCNVASGDAGEEFITKLHKLTGANIGASATKTGNVNLGGDWNLEVSIGAVSHQRAFTSEVVDAYSSVLGIVNKGTSDTPGLAWGITVVGNYAYVGDGNKGLSIIDISDPTKPTLVSTFDSPGYARGVSVVGNYAYVADGVPGDLGSTPSLQIIDIINPKSPIFKGAYNTLISADSVTVVGNYAYVADGGAGLQIIDISNPSNPVKKGEYNTLGDAQNVTLVGNLAYVAYVADVADGSAGLSIIDISNPANPSLKGTYQTSDSIYGVTVVGNLAYVSGASSLSIIDISDPTKPTKKGSYDGMEYVYGIAIDGNIAYVADNYQGVQVIDISDPTKPTLQSSYSTTDQLFDLASVGKYLYAANGGNGLQVLYKNALPTAANTNIIVNKGAVYTFAATDFNFADTDKDDSLKEIEITQLPTKGEFFLDINSDNIVGSGEAITVNQKILKADLTKLKFKSASDASGDGYAKFEFKISDDYEYSTQAYTASLDINSAPTDLILNAISFSGTITAGIEVATFGSVDLNKSDKYTYSLLAGTDGYDNDAFTIEGGSLKIKASATKSSYKLRVRTTDAGGLFFDKDLTLNFKDSNLSTGTTDTKITQLIKISDDTFSFKSKTNNGNGKVKISFKLKEQNFKSVNELSVFTVDDAQGTINGIAPGAAGYAQAAFARAKVICSPIANLPQGFSFDDLSSVLEFSSSTNIRFYMVNNSTTNAVLSGQSSYNEVIFSSSTNFQTLDMGDDGFELDFKDTKKGGNFKVKIKATDGELPLGSNLQGKSQGELLDFREVKTKIKAEFKLHREAAFDNLIGFYRVNDENGGIDTNNDGTIDLRPEDALYAQAAVKARVSGMDMSVTNQTTATFSGIFEAGAIFAPFIIANGTADALLDSDTANDPKFYCSFLGANTGKASHVRLLGTNTFGFEDQAMGGDKDYNDVICQMKFTSM